tara:strand:+ start:1394 stop:1720 length:327 start_codon:yes stop_codon:yes gene_type:complete
MNTQNSVNTTKTRQGGCCCTSQSPSALSTQNGSGVSVSVGVPLQRLQVQGATCGGCVRSIEQTLRSVSGVTEACMDLATGVASVVGAVEANALKEALNQSGFPATVIK